MSFKRVKGTEDYYPEEYASVIAIENILREVALKNGFQEVDSGAMETISCLTAKSGEEIKEQIFTLEKRSKEELGLRFDLTIPIARMFIEKQKQLPKPAKWFAIGKMWRYEAPQKGRQREFTQLSVELLGSDKPEADAACINVILDCMDVFGVGKDIILRISNRKLLEGLLTSIIDKKKLEEVVRLIDKSGKIGKKAFEASLKDAGLKEDQIKSISKIIEYKGDKKILEKVEKELTLNKEAKEGFEELKQTLAFVDGSVQVDLRIARGLAYYTGNVYECFDKEGKYRALAGGGRYDQLIELMGGQSCPATGMAIGTATMALFLKDQGKLPKEDTAPEYYMAPVSEEYIADAIKIARKLRKKARVDVDLMRRKLGKQMDYAKSIGATKFIVVGEKEKSGKLTVKDLSTGKETKI